MEGRKVVQGALELLGCPSQVPAGSPPSPFLLSGPHHPGLGIWPPLPGRRQSLGRFLRKPGHTMEGWRCGPRGSFSLPLKTLHHQKHSECFPDASSDLPFTVKKAEEFSTEPISSQWFGDTSTIPACHRAGGFMPSLKGQGTHLRVSAQVTGSAPTNNLGENPGETDPGAAPPHTSWRGAAGTPAPLAGLSFQVTKSCPPSQRQVTGGDLEWSNALHRQ